MSPSPATTAAVRTAVQRGTDVVIVSEDRIINVDEINAEYRACRSSYGKALEHAVKCGKLLHEAHLKIGHGSWKGWVEENFEGSQRTAQEYTQLYYACDQDPRLVDEADSINAAFAYIGRQASGTHELNLDEPEIVDATVVDDESHIIQEPSYTLTAEQLMTLVSTCSTWAQALRLLREWGLSE